MALSRSLLLPLLAALAMPAHAQDHALLIIKSLQDPCMARIMTWKPSSALTGPLGFDPASQITVLEDGQASKEAILKALADLEHTTQAGDRVVLYYSGHGELMADDDGDEKRDGIDNGFDEALLPYDVAQDRNDQRNWLRDDVIQQYLVKLKGRKLLAVFDSCHAGTATRGGASGGLEDAKIPGWDAKASSGGGLASDWPVDFGYEDKGLLDMKSQDFVGFFAVHPRQLAIDNPDTLGDPSRPHSVFTQAFVEGTMGAADGNRDQQVSYRELLEYTRKKTDEYCADHKDSNACKTHPAPLLQMDANLAANDFLSFGQAAPASPLDTAEALLAHGNAAGLQLAIEALPLSGPSADQCREETAQPCLNLRQKARCHINSGGGGKLLLFDLRDNGQLVPLFPFNNEGHGPKPCRKFAEWSEHIPANTRLTLPNSCLGFEITAQEPLGPGKLVAVLVEDGPARDTPRPAVGEPLTGVNSLKTLREALDNVVPGADGIPRAVEWSITTVDYVIR